MYPAVAAVCDRWGTTLREPRYSKDAIVRNCRYDRMRASTLEAFGCCLSTFPDVFRDGVHSKPATVTGLLRLFTIPSKSLLLQPRCTEHGSGRTYSCLIISISLLRLMIASSVCLGGSNLKRHNLFCVTRSGKLISVLAKRIFRSCTPQQRFLFTKVAICARESCSRWLSETLGRLAVSRRSI